MAYGELFIQPQRRMYNALNGHFLKGHTPHNKGKKWSEWMGKRAQKRCAKGWKNIELHRGRPHNAGRNKRQVIAVMNDGTWRHFSFIGSAGEWVGGNSENVGRCCRFNQARHRNKKTGAVNTDHKYKGIRFYFEDDDVWTTKIKQ